MARIYFSLLLALALLSTCTKIVEPPPVTPPVTGEPTDTAYGYPPTVINNCSLFNAAGADLLPPLNGWKQRAITLPTGGIPWFFDRQHGFLCNYNGAIYKSSDGGNNWTKVYDDPNLEIRLVTFSSPQHGILFCAKNNQSYFLTTYDGGASWAWQSSPELGSSQNWSSFRFFSPGVGYLSNSQSQLLVTSDSAKTWETRTINTNVLQMGPIDYYSADTFYMMGLGLIGAQDYLILRSTDAGRTWENASAPFSVAASVKFLDSQVGYIYSDEGVAITRNGGVSWKVISKRKTSFAHFSQNGKALFYQEVASCAGMYAWAFVSTDDYGETWEAGNLNREVGVFDIYQYINDSTFYTHSFWNQLTEFRRE